MVPGIFWLKLIFTELFDTTRCFWILTCGFLSISSKLLIPQELVIEVSLWSFSKLNFWSPVHFGQSCYLRSYYNSWFLNPDRYISHNIFETINPTRISNWGKFVIISQAKLWVPNTFWLKLIFTELFDTTRCFWILTCGFLSISSKLLILQELVIVVSLWSFHKLNFWSPVHFGQSCYLRSYLIQLVVFESWPVHFSQYLRNY